MTNTMKTSYTVPQRGLTRVWSLLLACAILGGCGERNTPAADAPKDKPAVAAGDMVPLDLKLPQPAFKGTPKDQQFGPIVEPLSEKPRPAMMVPGGLKNVAAGQK